MREAISGTERLREERQRQQLGLRELAHFVGVSHTTIRKLERGEVDVSPAIKARLARALRIPVNELWPTDGEEAA